MRLKAGHILLVVAFAISGGLAAWKLLPREGAPAGASLAAAPTIESSGEILSVAIGMPMEQVRAKLDPLRAPAAPYEPDAKELQGRRIYWKLKNTEYDWVMVWANPDGKVTRVRAVFRPEHRKPFSEIGDLSRAITADAAMVRWDLHRPDKTNYRLVAQGAEHRAISVYMFSQALPEKEHRAPDAHLGETEKNM